MKNIKNFSGVRKDPKTGEEYVVHKPSGVIYLLRKPIMDIYAVAQATDKPPKPRPARARQVWPRLARATFIEGSEPRRPFVGRKK